MNNKISEFVYRSARTSVKNIVRDYVWYSAMISVNDSVHDFVAYYDLRERSIDILGSICHSVGDSTRDYFKQK